MKSPWPWLVLVAMAAASTPPTSSVQAVDYQADRYIDDDADKANSNNNNNNLQGDDNSNEDEQSQPKQNQCPETCTCYSRTYPSLGTLGPLTTVNCSGRGLVGFTALFPNHTQVLDMSHNKLINITTLPFLPDLLVLDVSSNWMRFLDNLWVFEHVPKLRVLSLADNGLQSLQHGSFSGLSDLRELDLSRNVIKRIDTHAFGGLVNLEVLKLQNNELYQLRREWLLSLTSLTSLYLGNNFVAKLDMNTFSKLGRLHHLDLSYNSLRYILDDALNGLRNLKLLNLSGNSNLRSVPSKALQPFSSLSILLLDGVAMSRLQPFGVSSIDVQEISMSFLPRLRVVEKSAFYNLTNLRTLQLHDNPHLVFLHPSAFSLLPFLRHLFIHNNGLIAVSSQLIISLPSLTDLHLHHNPLHCDCNIFWLRKELNRVYELEYKNKLLAGLDVILSTSNETVDLNTTSSSASSSTSSSASSSASQMSSTSSDNNSFPTALISEPDRVSCFFPAGKSSMPLIQLPIQYFSPTCPPTTLPLFSAFINVSIGDELWLECQGLGVPTPTLSWVLPGGLEVNYSTTSHHKMDASVRFSVEIVEDSLLYIPSVRQSDSGSYGCRAASVLGDDISTTVVHVQNKPLTLTSVKVSNDYITVSWKGSIPRIQMSDFQLFYRRVPDVPAVDEILDGTFNDSKQVAQTSKDNKFDVIFLHSSVHKCTISGLKPESTYEVCLMYKQVYPVECHNYTTTLDVDVVSADGIMRVSKTHLGIGVASVLGLLLLVVLVVVVRRIRHRKDYQDPVTEEDKTGIPLEGISHTAPSTPLTTSRTALLINNQI